ncbi:hypothetical protein BKH09_02455 [Actinomyces naeslundii]|uniref:hypothetical protein n=1 Tax=Actinomyces naeslundii TaxID=1655 RepID=UPI00094D478B|nr:hypothetical protein [Actinomyces naeslundii]OLO92921.1 hypothetical protein BKH09_02455 [Actinomyces naeslundii]
MTLMVRLSSILMMAGLFGDTLLSAATEDADRGMAGPTVITVMAGVRQQLADRVEYLVVHQAHELSVVLMFLLVEAAAATESGCEAVGVESGGRGPHR